MITQADINITSLSCSVVQLNSDARLEFGLETPLLHESDVPDAAALLESAKDQICSLLEIENDEEWKVCITSWHVLPQQYQPLCYTSAEHAVGNNILFPTARSLNRQLASAICAVLCVRLTPTNLDAVHFVKTDCIVLCWPPQSADPFQLNIVVLNLQVRRHPCCSVHKPAVCVF